MSLYTETTGTGSDLVLVHGWGLHGGIWGGFVPLLAARFRVTCVDLPGHGRSCWEGEETLDAITAAVLHVVPAPAVWLGWSLGGLVAARAAQMAPGNVTALVTIASTPCFVRKPGWQSAMLPTLLDLFAAELEQDYVRTLNRFLALQVRGSNSYGEVLKALRALLLAHGEPDAVGLRAGLKVLRTADLRDSLGDIHCPTLLVMGERDTLVPVTAGNAASDLFPDAQLAVIAGAGHAPFIAQPELVASLVHEFVCKKGGMRG
jgi:pimeloyl-[acyl-carrier protein] methyl ester esterase